ncbi:hypothetical protein CS8_055410 [Cupriavidus sp. 8B]
MWIHLRGAQIVAKGLCGPRHQQLGGAVFQRVSQRVAWGTASRNVTQRNPALSMARSTRGSAASTNGCPA